MKMTIVFKDNRRQIVITPENDNEKEIVDLFETKTYDVAYLKKDQRPVPAMVHRGSFYDCQGGWTREGSDDNSLIIVFDKE